MKKFLAALLIGLSLVSITLDASAARLGGGASFGRSMSVPKAAPSTPFNRRYRRSVGQILGRGQYPAGEHRQRAYPRRDKRGERP